jgi:hypothetical protein
VSMRNSILSFSYLIDFSALHILRQTVVEGGIFTRIVNHNTIINQISRTLKISSIAEQQYCSRMTHEFLQYTKVQNGKSCARRVLQPTSKDVRSKT